MKENSSEEKYIDQIPDAILNSLTEEEKISYFRKKYVNVKGKPLRKDYSHETLKEIDPLKL